MSVRVRERFLTTQPWVSLVVRVAAGAVMILAGVLKLQDLQASVRAVRAYQLLPEAVVPLVGHGLPFLEIALGFFLVLGLLTRAVALLYLAMMVTFAFGIVWAWAKGLQIDCGCFGGGGEVPEADYAGHLRDQGVFFALGAWLVIFPTSALSLERRLEPTHK